MYNVMIVDDEALMRTYLANNISSICPYFQVTGIACDGLDAMDLFQKQHFDLVITDIRMPEMDGLALAKYVYETNPSTKVIILSGYNEFEYARTAIKYKVSEYLLKPLKDTNLLEVLSATKEQLDIEIKKNTAVLSTSYKQLSDSLLLTSLLASIIDGNTSLTYPFFNEAERRGLPLMKNHGFMFMVTIDELHLLLFQNNTYDVTSYHLKLNQLCQDYCQSHNYVTYYDNLGTTFILVDGYKIENIPVTVNHIYEDLLELAHKNGLPKIIAACGSEVSDIMDLSYSSICAYDAFALSLLGMQSPILYEQALMNNAFLSELNSICGSIYVDYLSIAIDKLQADSKRYCSLFKKDLSVATLLRYDFYLLKYIRSRSNIKSHYMKAAIAGLTSDIDKLIIQNSLSEENAHTVIINTIKALISCDKAVVISETDQIVQAAKQFILTHYNEPISLSLVAEHVGVNSCYLSDLIHKNLGEPYSKYINRIRMEQASRILKENPNIKIYTVAEKTGFISTKHFISVFKKYYGMTPTNYISKGTSSPGTALPVIKK